MTTKATIVTVAARAGVSRQTVSNVIHQPHLVAPRTRRRVLAAIDELGYRPNQAARQMRTGRSRLIAVRIEPVVDGVNGFVLDRFLHGLTETASAKDYRIMLYTAAGDRDEIDTYRTLLRSHELDAFVLTSTHHGDSRTSWLGDHDVPFVTFGRPWDGPRRHPWVDVDGSAGTGAATRRLREAGHHRIGFLGWAAGSGVGDDRRGGWRQAMAGTGLDPSELDMTIAEDTPSAAAATVTAALAGPRPPTAVVCVSDSAALGALRAARSAGTELAVIGFDDTPVAAALGLTSVAQPLREVAAACVDLLTARLDGGGRAVESTVLLEPSLIVRETG